jgi:hypothetical protein
MRQTVFLFTALNMFDKKYNPETNELVSNEVIFRNYFGAGVDETNCHIRTDYKEFLKICSTQFGSNVSYEVGIPPGLPEKENHITHKEVGGINLLITRKPYPKNKREDFIDDLYHVMCEEVESEDNALKDLMND